MITNIALIGKVNEAVTAAAAEGKEWTPTSEVKSRLAQATQRYADLAHSIAINMAATVERLRTTEDFRDPRNAVAWAGDTAQLDRLRGEIDGLTQALEIAEHIEAKWNI